MIAPKTVKPSARDEAEAYELATLRDLDCCVFCGAHLFVQRDHRKNRSQGVETVTENLQCLCELHHTMKTVNPTWATRNGLQVPSWGNVSEWPAQRRINGQLRWVTYGPGMDYAIIPTDIALAYLQEKGIN